MMVSFGDDGTEAVFHGTPVRLVRRYPPEVVPRAVRKLDLLNGAPSVSDLEAPPGNRLESLRGDLKGFFSIRVNDQWGIIFRWQGSDAHDVRLVDYHR
jgi:proteic killer suppression protein